VLCLRGAFARVSGIVRVMRRDPFDPPPRPDFSEPLAALLEDFRAHWAQLLQVEDHIAKWITLYAAGMLLTAATFLGYGGSEKVLNEGKEFFYRPQAFIAILTLVVLNAGYVLSVAFKGYECQLLRLYMSEVIGEQVRRLGPTQFNTYELWRRRTFGTRGGNEWVRAMHYSLLAIVPFAVSLLLLGCGFIGVSRVNIWGQISFGVAVGLFVGATTAAVGTALVDSRWKRLATRKVASASDRQDAPNSGSSHGQSLR
jgi:hypothetical protein